MGDGKPGSAVDIVRRGVVADGTLPAERVSFDANAIPVGYVQSAGISRSIASSQARADMSDGARQSPRGDNAPP